jgi:putative addiction module component (TIGR02574 family)
MPKTLAEVTRDAAELSEVERLKLARILLEFSGPDPANLAEIEGAWEAEIEKRLQDLRSGRAKGVPLEEVKKKLKARLRS